MYDVCHSLFWINVDAPGLLHTQHELAIGLELGNRAECGLLLLLLLLMRMLLRMLLLRRMRLLLLLRLRLLLWRSADIPRYV
jgi:hypothetical protein